MFVSLVQLKRDDLAPGVPLSFAVFDRKRRLIHAEGEVIDSHEVVDELIADGAYRTSADGVPRAPKEQHALVPSPGAQNCSFEDMRLHPGDALQLQLQSGKTRYYVKYVGYLPGRSVLVTTPAVGGQVVSVREEQPVIARTFSGRSAFAFDGGVQRVCSLPFPYLHLSFPSVVQGVPVRVEPRIRMRMTASACRIASPNAQMPVEITDLSPSGARLDARDRIAAKDEVLRLSFRFTLDQEDAFFVNEAVVRSVREETRAGTRGEPVFRHGVEFVGMQANERLLLRTLIYQRLAEGRRD